MARRKSGSRPDAHLRAGPMRNIGVVTETSRSLHRGDESVGVPINNTSQSVDSNDMRHRRVGAWPHITLVVDLLP